MPHESWIMLLPTSKHHGRALQKPPWILSNVFRMLLHLPVPIMNTIFDIYNIVFKMWRDLQINLESTINLVRDQLGSVRNHDLGTKTSCKPLTQEFKSKGHNGTLYSLVYNLYNSTDKPSQVLRTWTQSGICTGVDFGGGLGMGNKFTDITTRFPAIISKCICFERIHMKPWANKTNFGSSYVTRITSLGAPNGSWVFCHGGALSFVKCLTSQTPSFFLITQVQAKWPISIKSLFKLQFDFSVAIRCSIMVYCWRVTVTLRYTTRILLLLLHATTHGSRWFMSVHEFMKVIQHHFNSKCLSLRQPLPDTPAPNLGRHLWCRFRCRIIQPGCLTKKNTALHGVPNRKKR